MIIHFLQSLYNQTKLPEEKNDYMNLIEDIKHFSIEPQVYHLLKQQDRLNETPAFVTEFLKKATDQILHQNLFIKVQMEKILKLFETQKIDTIPLKGVYFAEKYFGHIAARSTSDIDLLIHKKDRKTIDEILRDQGFIYEIEAPKDHFHCSYRLDLPGSSIPLRVEIHWNLLKENTSNLNIQELWQDAVPKPSYKHIKELSHQHAFYMIVLHAWRHNLDSLRHFIDVIQMVNVLDNKLCLESLFIQSKKDKTLKRVQRTLRIVYRVFGEIKYPEQLSVPKNYGKWWEYEKIRDREYRSLRVYVDFFDFEYLSYENGKHKFRAVKEYYTKRIHSLSSSE
ncbi:nucleotidyltransferase family protein [Metabacillus idriensis]|uniref:nucleotidyltransferase family protein n=1 Tax=Metabacillus idriensis TaxID=324768 RepID=UPI00174B7255|nr:nucleotidyltransferase family protein [Metabacillus idriensis]